nr:hypothetical protein [Sicyoidochytrium minutum DNA virus]
MEITNAVRELFDQKEKMRVIAAKVKDARAPIKDAISELEEQIKAFMLEVGHKEIQYEDRVLVYKEAVRSNGLSKKSLKAALVKYFKGDEADAEDCFKEIMDIIGTKTVVILGNRKLTKKELEEEKKSQKQGDDEAPSHDPESTIDQSIFEAPDLDYSSD